MNTNRIICLLVVLSALSIPVLAETGNQANSGTATSVGGNIGVTGNAAITVTETPMAPITDEDKTRVTNIALNITVNIGINNTQIVDVTRDEDNKENLRVRVKDLDTDEIIVVIVTPQGEAKSNIPEAKFTESANSFSGKHVTFQFTKDTITDFTVNGKLIFKSVNLGFTSTNVKRVGSELRISDDKNLVIIHDNDNGIITENSKGNTEEIFEAASGVKVSGNEKRVDLSSNVKASILSNDPDTSAVVSSISGSTINVKINNGESTFIVNQANDDFDNRVVDGIALKQIGGVINIDSDSSSDITTFNVDTTVNKVITNTVSLNVSSATSEGKVIAIKVNKDILQDLNLRTLVDGDDIQKAVDFDDLFKNDKLSFLIVIGQEVEVLISIPKFSEHQIVVTSAAPATGTVTGTVVQTTMPQTTVVETSNVTMTTTAPKSPGFTSGLMLAVFVVLYVLVKRRK